MARVSRMVRMRVGVRVDLRVRVGVRIVGPTRRGCAIGGALGSICILTLKFGVKRIHLNRLG